MYTVYNVRHRGTNLHGVAKRVQVSASRFKRARMELGGYALNEKKYIGKKKKKDENISSPNVRFTVLNTERASRRASNDGQTEHDYL